jgi:hypothetical protein
MFVPDEGPYPCCDRAHGSRPPLLDFNAEASTAPSPVGRGQPVLNGTFTGRIRYMVRAAATRR